MTCLPGVGISLLGRRTDALPRSEQDSYLSSAKDRKAIPPDSLSYFGRFPNLSRFAFLPVGEGRIRE
jgi:hypothetical protein